MTMPVVTPAQIEPYVRVLGQPLTVKFLLTFGGAELYLARAPKVRSRLVKLLGVEKAEALASAADHMQARIPTAKPWIAQVLRQDGLSVAEIARTLHTTDVTVRKYLADTVECANEPPRQPRFL